MPGARENGPLLFMTMTSKVHFHVHLFLLFTFVLPIMRSVAQTLPPEFSEALVMSGFYEPVGCTWDATGRSYVWEKRGMVWIIENGLRLPDPLIDLSEEVGNWRDHGMLGFTLDPDFMNNGYIYLMYVVDRHHLLYYGTPQYDPDADIFYEATIVRITRYTAIGPDHNTIDPASRSVLLGETEQSGGPILHESHGAGSLAFGTDGTLLATIGDGATYYSVDVGNASDTYHIQAMGVGIIRPEENVGALRAQMVNSLNGKLLRLDPMTGDGIPSNPWYDASDPRAPRSRVWAMGLRNAYRFTVKPGSGSTDPAAGDPGTVFLGDVGWNLWEELNVVTGPGMNFGWPLFEGFNSLWFYMDVPTANRDAPNPLYDGAGCDEQFFDFQDLIVQDTPVHAGAHPNPCDPGEQIPNTVPKHFHSRPAIDWRHGNQSRTGAFVNDIPVTFDLDDPDSPVPGPRFGGFAAIGGPWMAGTELPAGYQGATFHADYAMGFIKRFMFDEDDHPVSVHDFASGLGAITWLGAGPDGCIWYISYNTNELRRICSNVAVDLPPEAIATAAVEYGPSPLIVPFTSSGSSDPGGGPITYQWDFGDGAESTDPDPTHTFNAPAGVPTAFEVTLTVTDQAGQSSSTTLIVSVNNTPPVAQITSFEDGDHYFVGMDSVFVLQAEVSDAEHGPDELTYAWQTFLHHNTHNHPEPIDNDPVTTTMISGIGCDGEEYSYRIRLTVTDAAGLSTIVEQWLYPACDLIAPTAVIAADPVSGFAPLEVQFDGTGSYDPGTIVSYYWYFGDGTTSTDAYPTKTFTAEGPHYVTLLVTDDDGLSDEAVRVINVLDLDPPQCVGPMGGLLREVWTGVPGAAISDLLSSVAYQGPPTSSAIITGSAAPQNTGVNYGARVRGYIVPEVSGLYQFILTSDNASVAFLSPNSDPVNKQPIANVPGYTDPDEYDVYSTQTSLPIALEAGVYYYVELLHKQSTASDHLTLRWKLAGAGEPEVIPANMLAPWQDCSPGIRVRGALDGAAGTNGLPMRDDLREQGLLPMTEPYSALGYVIDNTGAAIDADVLAITGQNAVVDWVIVELRDQDDPAVIVSAMAVLLQRDGDIVGTDGYSRLLFNVPADEYHVALRHRNHLGVMTAGTVMVDAAATLIDLTGPSTATYGTEARKPLANGKMGLWAGNVRNDGVLRYLGAENDREPVLIAVGGTVPTNVIEAYHVADVNMDGKVKYNGHGNDRDPILVNVGGVVPTEVRWEQLP